MAARLFRVALAAVFALGVMAPAAAPGSPRAPRQQSVRPWPYPITIRQDVVVLGSSTVEASGTNRAPSVVQWLDEYTSGGTYLTPAASAPSSGSVIIANRGTNGFTNADLETKAAALSAREKAANVIVSYGGNYTTSTNPLPGVLTSAANIAASIGHSRILWVPKHFDNLAPSGTFDHFRLRQLDRKLRAAGYLVDDASLMFRRQASGLATDDDEQLQDQIPPSWGADANHANGSTGAKALAVNSYLPWLDAREGGPAFVPNQRIFSTAGSTNQTAGGLVGTLQYDSTIPNTLLGQRFDVVGSPHFSVAIESGALTLRRATGTLLNAGAYDFQIRSCKAQKCRTSWVQVSLGDTASTSGAFKTNINSQAMSLEGPVKGVTSSQKFSIAFCFEPNAGEWDSPSTSHNIAQTFGTGGLTVQVLTTFRMRLQASDAGGVVFRLDSPTGAGNLFNEANGFRCYFGAADFTGGGQYNMAIDSGAQVTTGASTFTVGATPILFPAVADAVYRLFSGSIVSGTGPYAVQNPFPGKVSLLWISDGYVDWTTTNRNLVRDATTKASVLNTTRGSDAPGVVAGVSPVIWMEGPAGNWRWGHNFADPTEPWDTTDRAQMTSQAVP